MDDFIASSSPDASSALDWLASVRRREQSLRSSSLNCPQGSSSRKTTFVSAKAPQTSTHKPLCRTSKKLATQKNSSSLPSQSRTSAGALGCARCIEEEDTRKKKHAGTREETDVKHRLGQGNPHTNKTLDMHSHFLQREREKKRSFHNQRKKTPTSTPSPPEREDNGGVMRGRPEKKSNGTRENRFRAAEDTIRCKEDSLRKLIEQGFPGVPDLAPQPNSKCPYILCERKKTGNADGPEPAFGIERTVSTLWRIPHRGDRTIERAGMSKSACGLPYRVLSGGEILWLPDTLKNDAFAFTPECPLAIQHSGFSRIVKEMPRDLHHSGIGHTYLLSRSCPVHSVRTDTRTPGGAFHVSGVDDQRDVETSKVPWETKSNTTLLGHEQGKRHLSPSSSYFPIAESMHTASSSSLPRLGSAQHWNYSLHLAHPNQKASDSLLTHEKRASSFSFATIAGDGTKSHPWKADKRTQTTDTSQSLTAAPNPPFTSWKPEMERETSQEEEKKAALCLCEVPLSASTTAGTSESTQSSSYATSAEICLQPSLASLVKFAGRAMRVDGRQRLYRNASTVLGHGFSGDVKIFKHRHTQELFALKTVLNEDRMPRGWRFSCRGDRRPCPGSCPAESLRGDFNKEMNQGNALPGKTQRIPGTAGGTDTVGDLRGTRRETEADKLMNKSQNSGKRLKDNRTPRACGAATQGRHPAGKGPKQPVKAAEDKDKNMKEDLQAILGEGVYACLSADHPSIIKLIEFVEDDEGVHLIMPVCQGGPLSRSSLRRFLTGSKTVDRATVRATGKCNAPHGGDMASPWQTGKSDEESWKSWERVAKKFTWQILKALRHLHTQGIIHRDVKAQNFLLVEPSHPTLLLIDFGFSLFTSTNALNHPDDEFTVYELKERAVQKSKAGHEPSLSFPPFSPLLHPPLDSPFLTPASVNADALACGQRREEAGTFPSSTNTSFRQRNTTNQPSTGQLTLEDREMEIDSERARAGEVPCQDKIYSCLGGGAAMDTGSSLSQTQGENTRKGEMSVITDTFFLSCMTRNSWKGPSELLSKRIVGTPGMHPPEVLRHTSYTPAADIWGLGLVVHALLTGSLMPELASSGNLLFDETHARVISPSCRDFLERCLRRRQKMRITAAESLYHPWLEEERLEEEAKINFIVQSAQDPDSSVHRMIDNMRSFPLHSLFHRLFYLLLAYALPPSEIPEEVEVLFYAFDRSRRGMVFYDDFLLTLRSLDLSIRDPEALEIFMSMYTSTRTVYSATGCCLHQGVHALEFTPFLAGVMDKHLLLHANSLRRLFCRLDPLRKGTVAVEKVISLLGSGGRLRDELRHYLAELGIEAKESFSFEGLAIALAQQNGLRNLCSRPTGLVRQQALLSPPEKQSPSYNRQKNGCSYNCLSGFLWRPLNCFSVSLSPRQRKRSEGNKNLS